MPLCEARSDFYPVLKCAIQHNTGFYFLGFGETPFGLQCNYKENHILPPVPFLANLWIQSLALNHSWPHRCQRWQNFLSSFAFRAGQPFLEKDLEKLKEDSWLCKLYSNLKLYISFFFKGKSWENIALIHISKIITIDSRHLSCCHWNLGKVIHVVLQVTN